MLFFPAERLEEGEFEVGALAADKPLSNVGVPASPMAEGQVQGPWSGEDTIPEGLLVRNPGAVQPTGMGRTLSACEGVIEPCPRAGCLKRARPVR